MTFLFGAGSQFLFVRLNLHLGTVHSSVEQQSRLQRRFHFLLWRTSSVPLAHGRERLVSKPGTSMQTCGLATVRSADVRLACRHAVGGGAARSLSSPVARTTRWTRGSSGVRLSRIERAQVVAAANAPRSCDRNLLVVGPGVLGSLVCQRWLNVRARLATPPSV